MAWSPQELPFLAEKAARQYLEGAAWLEAHLDEDAAPDALDRAYRIADWSRRTAQVLDEAPMIWLDEDVCGLIATAAHSVPEWSPDTVQPGECGLVAFETPVLWLDTRGPDGVLIEQVPVHAIGWQPEDETHVSLSFFSTQQVPHQWWAPDTALTEILWSSFDTSEVDDGAVSLDNRARVATAQGRQALATVGAIWLLMAQPTVVADGPSVTSQVKRRAAPGRGGPTGRAPVAVSTRRLTQGAGGGGGRTGRKATTRWWVRGHWRQQPWGKGGLKRRPVWIAPHTAGHPDAEVDERPQVQVWRK